MQTPALAQLSLNELFKLGLSDDALEQQLVAAIADADKQIHRQLAEEVEGIRPHKPIAPVAFDTQKHLDELNDIVEQINGAAEELQELVDYETAYCLVQDQLCGFVSRTQHSPRAREQLVQAVKAAEARDIFAVILRTAEQ